jgi:hypothetical protein
MFLGKLWMVLHVGGAIVGFGPIFGFSVMGPMAGRLGGPQGLGILKAMLKIQKGIVIPMAVVQGVTGLFLISALGYDKNFVSHTWLVVSILLYLVALAVAFFVLRPTLSGLVALGEDGKADGPEFGALVRKSQTFGPILTLLLVIIIVLMVLRPGRLG